MGFGIYPKKPLRGFASCDRTASVAAARSFSENPRISVRTGMTPTDPLVRLLRFHEAEDGHFQIHLLLAPTDQLLAIRHLRLAGSLLHRRFLKLQLRS
jgi:hypothetical protein